MSPSVGKILHYASEDGSIHAAIVTGVNRDSNSVNLFVFHNSPSHMFLHGVVESPEPKEGESRSPGWLSPSD